MQTQQEKRYEASDRIRDGFAALNAKARQDQPTPDLVPAGPAGQVKAVRPYRPVLVDINMAMAALSRDLEGVLEMVDSGQLLWVFDFSRKGASRRELRFWWEELIGASQLTPKVIDTVVEKVVGHEPIPHLRNRTVAGILGLRHTTVQRFCRAREIPGKVRTHTLWISRPGLVKWLKRRWIGSPPA